MSCPQVGNIDMADYISNQSDFIENNTKTIFETTQNITWSQKDFKKKKKKIQSKLRLSNIRNKEAPIMNGSQRLRNL